MQNLYQQLLYNWERGFYSVVKDAEGYFSIVSMKPGEDYGVYGTWFKRSVSDCKDMVGNPNVTSFIGYKDADQYTVVDTINPSELMGKGFQVGDFVKIKNNIKHGKETGVIDIITYEGTYHLNGPEYYNHYFKHQDLKPVLPVEEKKDNCVVCKEQSPREGSNLFCESCKQQLLSGEPKEAVNSSVCKLCGHGTGIGFTTKEFETYIKVNGYIRMLEQGDKNARVEASIVNKSKRKKKIKN